MNVYRYLPIVVLLVLSITIFYSFFLPSKTSMASSTGTSASETNLCLSGNSEPCTVNSCSGIRTCTNGIWGGCIYKQICNPGEKANCYAQTCSVGTKICNQCGSGYGTCVFGDTIRKNKWSNITDKYRVLEGYKPSSRKAVSYYLYCYTIPIKSRISIR